MLDRGIYRIKHIASGKLYIGSAVNLKVRRGTHFAALKSSRHDNSKLQRAYDKYGEDAFEFRIMRYIEKRKDLIKIEQFYLDMYKPFYNICKIAGSSLGFKFSKEDRKRMSESRSGENNPQYGKVRPEEHCKNLSKSTKIAHSRPETKQRRDAGYKRKMKPVLQYTIDGELVMEHESIGAAAKSIGRLHRQISLCCRGVYEMFGGYKWEFKD